MPITNPGVLNATAAVIPDQAEVWIALKSNVTSISTMMPVTPNDDLAALGWSHCGLIDEKKGIPLTPAIEVKEFDAFGHPMFRVKLRNAKLKTGFTVLETNPVTKSIVLPGSAANKIGPGRNIQIYVLYRFVDEGSATVWVQLTPAAPELKSHGGIMDGEITWAELVVHHTTDSNNDVFQVVQTFAITKTYTIGTGVTAYTTTVDGQTTSSISTLTSTALQTALRALSNVGSTGVTVTGTGGAPGTLTALFTVSVSAVTSSGTGGTVTVA